MSVQDNEAIVRRLLDEAYNKRNLTVGDELLARLAVLYCASLSLFDCVR